jgi:DNA-binding response OmpR family regulator
MNLSSPKTTRLLLVEDDQEYASFIQLILARSELGKFEISLANLLQNAIQLLQHHTYDIILLDLILPDSPGQ